MGRTPEVLGAGNSRGGIRCDLLSDLLASSQNGGRAIDFLHDDSAGRGGWAGSLPVEAQTNQRVTTRKIQDAIVRLPPMMASW